MILTRKVWCRLDNKKLEEQLEGQLEGQLKRQNNRQSDQQNDRQSDRQEEWHWQTERDCRGECGRPDLNVRDLVVHDVAKQDWLECNANLMEET